MKLKLGQEAKDKVTGFQGILTGYCHYITGCDQYLIQPKCEKNTTFPEAQWIDEGKIELIEGGRSFEKEDIEGDEDGCDSPSPHK